MTEKNGLKDFGEFVAMKYEHNPYGAFSVDWYIGKRCNFDCSYCADYLHDNKTPHVPKDKMIRLVDTLQGAYGSNIMWSICGGEPTIIPYLTEVMAYIRKKGAYDISITTNLSRKTDYFLELYPYLNNITASLHFEIMAGKAEEYTERIIALENWRRKWNEEQEKLEGFPNAKTGWRRKTLLVRFMMYPGQFDNILKMKSKLEKAGVEKIEFRYIRPLRGLSNEQMPTKKLGFDVNHDRMDAEDLHENDVQIKSKVTPSVHGKSMEAPDHEVVSSVDKEVIAKIKDREEWYTEEEKKTIRQLFAGEPKKFLRLFFAQDDRIVEEGYHYNQLNFERKNNFEGWLCWAGTKHMKITPSGDIYIGSCHVGGKLGNIYSLDASFVLPKEPVVCPKWRCTDNLDLRVPKAKGPEYAHLVADQAKELGSGL
ncbi:MAG: radical SAM protein [Bdellovibrionales bacterium]|nr:radical SAM protein [Bdellovibrionales bacterium]